jgi:hypothetical protein
LLTSGISLLTYAMDATEIKRLFDGMSKKFETLDNTITVNKASIEETITRSTAEITKDIANIREHVIAKLVEENRSLRSRVRTLESRMLALEKTTYKIDQNHRKNNIELDGIPSTVGDADLTENVVRIFNDITHANITEKDIEACHRMPSKRNPKPTIVRASRNIIDKVRKNKKSLKDIAQRLNFPQDSKIYVNDNLSPNMRTIHFNARNMKKAGIIEDTWFSNAAVRIKLKNGENLVVTHESELYEAYPRFEGFSFDTEFFDRVLNADMDKMDDVVGDFGVVTELDS